MYTLTPKPGDTVRIRLHDGRAVDAAYDFHFDRTKNHKVWFCGEPYLAGKEAPRPYTSQSYIKSYIKSYINSTRFIYPLELMGKPEVRE